MPRTSTRFNIEKLNESDVQKHGGSKHVGFKQHGSDVKIGVHMVQVQKRVWFEVKLQGAQRNRKVEVIQDSNDDVRVTQRKLEFKQLKGKTNTNFLVNVKIHLSVNVRHKL
ncbi:hypothetical protein Tco_1464311 [Tanacetum coccineum]